MLGSNGLCYVASTVCVTIFNIGSKFCVVLNFTGFSLAMLLVFTFMQCFNEESNCTAYKRSVLQVFLDSNT